MTPYQIKRCTFFDITVCACSSRSSGAICLWPMERARAQMATPDDNPFYDAFNASPVGIAVENLEGQPLFVNSAFLLDARFQRARVA